MNERMVTKYIDQDFVKAEKLRFISIILQIKPYTLHVNMLN